MKIEFGFQANCSELVTNICPMEHDQIVTAMKTLKDAFGGTWRGEFTIDEAEYSILIPIEELHEYLDIDPETIDDRCGIDLLKLARSNEAFLPDVAFRHMTEPGIETKIPKTNWFFLNLRELPPSESVVLDPDPKTYLTTSFSFRSPQGDSKGAFYYFVEDLYIRDYPAYHKIRSVSGNRSLAGDGGGGITRYLDWMFMQLMRFDVDESERLFRLIMDCPDGDEDIESRMEQYRMATVLPNTTLLESDMDEVREMFTAAFCVDQEKQGRPIPYVDPEEMSELQLELLRSYIFDDDTNLTSEDIRTRVFGGEG